MQPPIKSKKPFLFEWWDTFFKIYSNTFIQSFISTRKLNEDQASKISIDTIFKQIFLDDCHKHLSEFQSDKGEIFKNLSNLYNMNNLNMQNFSGDINFSNLNSSINFNSLSGGINLGNYSKLYGMGKFNNNFDFENSQIENLLVDINPNQLSNHFNPIQNQSDIDMNLGKYY